MRGDLYGKGDYLHGRRPQDGMLTPSYTPGSSSILQPGAGLMSRNCVNNGNGGQPVQYHRQGSNESGKGSYSSDKEMGGNGGSNGFCNGVGGGGGGAISVANPVALHRYLSCASRLLSSFPYPLPRSHILSIYRLSIPIFPVSQLTFPLFLLFWLLYFSNCFPYLIVLPIQSVLVVGGFVLSG